MTPNSDTPYSFAWLDLRAEPMVISVPAVDPKRYYSLISLTPTPTISVNLTCAAQAALLGVRSAEGPNPDFLLGGRTSASAECRHWSGRAVRWSSCAILLRSAFACQWKSASGARTGMQLVNTSAKRLHCQSEPSAALVGDVRLTDSNAATQANIANAAISTTTLWVEVKSWPWLRFYGRNNKEEAPLCL